MSKNPVETREIIAEGKFLKLVRDNGWEVASRVGAGATRGVVAIIATTANDELVLVRQFRVPVQAYVWDLPAGLVDSMAEHMHDAAARELLEETGYAGRSVTILTKTPTSPGLTDEMVTYLRIPGCQKVAKGGGIDNENIETAVVRESRVMNFLGRAEVKGDLIDPKIYAALWLMTREPVREDRRLASRP